MYPRNSDAKSAMNHVDEVDRVVRTSCFEAWSARREYAISFLHIGVFHES